MLRKFLLVALIIAAYRYRTDAKYIEGDLRTEKVHPAREPSHLY